MLAMAASLVGAFFGGVFARRLGGIERRRRHEHRCWYCDYDMPVDGPPWQCPECGRLPRWMP